MAETLSLPKLVDDAALEVATGIKRQSWRRYRMNHKGPPFIKINGNVRYRLDEVLKWLERHTVTHNE